MSQPTDYNLVKAFVIKAIHNFHSLSPELKEDLFQEGYVAYLEAMKTYDSTKGAVSTHVFWPIHNAAVAYLKEEQQYIPVEDIEERIQAEEEDVQPHQYYTPEDQAIHSELLDKVKAKLTEEEVALLNKMLQVPNFTTRQLGLSLGGVTKSGVYSRVKRLREKMAEILEELENE